ncbi:NAD(P)/FAD-dependent oxidoreductase [Leifsonia poae]|uniref:Oxidoreductase YurR n=1 Tax=Leifsonia poae TaxID=110933 RepID=A0A9W6LYW1_9MICO|nr:FAD-dependent oxidoreductase [Leifsonia poae]GLJ75270.1 putative oxidoreductase YurR [Leifsonia poae]
MSARTSIVIGTGVAGAATAFGLARRGVTVTMVEAEFDGRATAAGAGIIQPWSSSVDGEFYRLYAAGADYYDELIRRLAETGVHDIGYRRAGALVVNRDSGVLDDVEARVAARAADAPAMGTVSRISGERARELFPPLGPDFEALHIAGGARVDGRALRAGLLAASQSLGAVVVPGTASLVSAPRGGWAVAVGDRVLEADSIVVAAGAWTDRVIEPLGLRIAVEPQRGQITHLRVGTADTRSWPSVHPVASHYLVAFDDSRVVVGATRETGSGFDPRVTADGQRQILENALSVAPGLADATLIETRVGLRPLPKGELPIVGALEGFDGLYVNAGFGAAGLTMGPLVGDRLAAVIDGETPPPAAGLLAPVAAHR